MGTMWRGHAIQAWQSPGSHQGTGCYSCEPRVPKQQGFILCWCWGHGSFAELICSQIPPFPPFHTLSVKSLGSQTCPVKTPLTLLFYPHSVLSLHGPSVTYAKLRQKSCLLVASSDNDADSSIGQLPESTSMLENDRVPLAHQQPITSSLRKSSI